MNVSGPRRRALVVDDEAQIRRILRAYLEAEAFIVVESGCGHDALERIGRDPVDVVLLDVGLPDIDGLEVLRRTRAGSDDVSVILVTARAEEGRLTMDMRRLDLSGVVAAAVERLRPQIDDAGLTLATAGWDAGPITVDADPDRLGQVVTNLIGNAVRATPVGGRVVVTVARRGAAAAIDVEDSGVGLAAGDLERVFERFYRVPSRGAEAVTDGSGIGLTISRGIMRAHGGDLVAHSAGVGHGARFEATLPVAE